MVVWWNLWWHLMNPRDGEQNLCSSKVREDRIAGKGITSMTHFNFVHKFIPMPQAMKIPDAKKLPWTVNEKARDNSSMEFGKSRAKRMLFWKHKETKVDLCHLKNSELEPKEESCLRRHCERRLRSLCSIY